MCVCEQLAAGDIDFSSNVFQVFHVFIVENTNGMALLVLLVNGALSNFYCMLCMCCCGNVVCRAR